MAAREQVLQVRISDEGLAAIDQARGSWTRSEFVRASLSESVKRGLRGPATKGM